MQSFRKIISLFLLVTLSVFIIPKEGIHCLSGHEDDNENECSGKGTIHFHAKQHHCDILNLEVPLYEPQECFTIKTCDGGIESELLVSYLKEACGNQTSYFKGRAPPSLG